MFANFSLLNWKFSDVFLLISLNICWSFFTKQRFPLNSELTFTSHGDNCFYEIEMLFPHNFKQVLCILYPNIFLVIFCVLLLSFLTVELEINLYIYLCGPTNFYRKIPSHSSRNHILQVLQNAYLTKWSFKVAWHPDAEKFFASLQPALLVMQIRNFIPFNADPSDADPDQNHRK